MAVKIGHSVMDENGKATGGKAGDQTGKEICTRGWYNGGWTCVLRPKSSALAEKSAIACESACANDNVGYDQKQRNTLYTQAKKLGFDLSQIITKCECDCSSLMHVCAIAGGAHLSYGSNGETTRTMVSAFVESGDYDPLTDNKYLTSDKYLMRGDVLVKPGSHTVMVLENGSGVIDVKFFKKYTGTTGSIVDALRAIGEKSSFSYRKTIAKANGITGYIGTAAQNTKMVNLLKAGNLIKP